MNKKNWKIVASSYSPINDYVYIAGVWTDGRPAEEASFGAIGDRDCCYVRETWGDHPEDFSRLEEFKKVRDVYNGWRLTLITPDVITGIWIDGRPAEQMPFSAVRGRGGWNFVGDRPKDFDPDYVW